MRTSVWTTRDGQEVRVCDMSDSHLLNTIRWLDMDEAVAMFSGECYEHSDIHYEMECEAKERGLEIER